MRPLNKPAADPSHSYDDAYKKAQHLLKSSKEEVQMSVSYTRIFTDGKEIKKNFQRIIPGVLLGMTGNEFFWKRNPGQACVLFAKNKDKGIELTKVCRLDLPEPWIGVGKFIIDWPIKKKGDEPLLLITLYLHSLHCADFSELVQDIGGTSAYLASIFFDKEHAETFFALAEENFASLR